MTVTDGFCASQGDVNASTHKKDDESLSCSVYGAQVFLGSQTFEAAFSELEFNPTDEAVKYIDRKMEKQRAEHTKIMSDFQVEKEKLLAIEYDKT